MLKKWGIKHGFMTNQAAAVKSGDTGNHEAIASAHYWKNLFPASWQFFRHREGPPPNNLLNYGYAIICATMARALTGAGLLPTFGIFHRNRYNAYCLADNIMEPYRPFVYIIVRTTIDQTSTVETLTPEFKNKLLNLPTADVLIDDSKSPLMVAMQRTATSLARCYGGEQRKLLYPEMVES